MIIDTRTVLFKPALLALAIALAWAPPASGQAKLPRNMSADITPSTETIGIAASHESVVQQIKAAYAYLQGITGNGVTVAILDTGIYDQHPGFSSPNKLLPGYNVITGTSEATDYIGHGTHVAGLIGATQDSQGMAGIAYGARLLPIKVFPDQEAASTRYLDAGVRYAIGKASIVNMSLGASTAYDARALQEAVQAGLLIVTAAGNDANATPQWPARFAKETWANNQIIAVGAVDEHNRIAAFSNRAGDTAPWFLVAPGVDIASAYFSQYAYLSGTSMAAPIVSGAAALLKQRWPYLHADQIANILFVTATDLGEPGIDPIYGRGLLNIERALQPVGAITTTTWNGVAIKMLGSALAPSSATSRLWDIASSGNLRIVGVDEFRRDFRIDLASTVRKPIALSLDQVWRSAPHIDVAERLLADGTRASWAYAPGSAAPTAGVMDTSPMQHPRLVAFSLRSARTQGMEMALGLGNPNAYFGLAHSARMANLDLPPALDHPYLALAPVTAYAALNQRLAPDVTLSLGWLTSGLNQVIASQESICISPTLWSPTPKTDTALLTFSKDFPEATVSLSFSRIQELNAYLGAQTAGALAFGPTIVTNAIQFAGAWRLAPHIALAGQIAYGITPSGAINNSLITDLSTTRTNAFAFGFIASNRFIANDRLSITLAQPLRAYQGNMILDVVSSIDGNGMELRERRLFSMTPEAREIDLETRYQIPTGQNANTSLVMTLRRHPNNFIDAPSEQLLALRYMARF